MLRFEQVSKCYRRRDGTRVALDNVSLQLDRGQVMGLFGPSGAGKTTLLRIAAGRETPDSGRVLYKGEDLLQMSAARMRRFRRREIGCIWAGESWTPGLSALEHVALPLLIDGDGHKTAERAAKRVMDSCEVGSCAQVDPAELSDGELRRVAIARALVSEPRVLLADGAVSNLSIIEQEQVMLLLASQASEAKVAVLVTDTGAASMIKADPILFLREGRLIEDEPPGEIGRVYQLPRARASRPAADA